MAIEKEGKKRIRTKTERLALGWHVSQGMDYRKAAEYAEQKGHKRLASKLRKIASEEDKKWQ